MGIQRKFVKRARHHGLVVLRHPDWGSRCKRVYAWRLLFRRHAKLPSDTLWQHITVTHDDGDSKRDFKADMREVEGIGQGRFGTGFSYNLGIDMTTGMVGMGQPFKAEGSHTLNHKKLRNFSFDQNHVALAMSFIGMPGDRLSKKAIESAAKVLCTLMEIGALTKHFDYMPHNAVAYKSCPTDQVERHMSEIKKRAFEIMNDHEKC